MGAYFQSGPFGMVLAGLEDVKMYWENEYGSPPWGHAELASLQAFTKKMGFDLDNSMAVLKDKGFQEVHPRMLLKDLAGANDTSPKAILDILQAHAKPNAIISKNDGGFNQAAHTNTKAPSGLGRLTLADMCQKAGVGIDQAVKRLSVRLGISATPSMKIKEIAQDSGETPSSIWDLIQP